MMRTPWIILAAALGAAAQSGGMVSGRVGNSVNGDAIGGATVTLRGMGEGTEETYITETGADGRFAIRNIAPGVYEPRPSKQGYEQRKSNHFATANDFPPVTVEAGAPAAPIELKLIPDGVVAGRVVTADGDPVRRAQVQLEEYRYAGGKKQLMAARTMATDDRGQYRIYNAPPGKYYLHVAPGNQMGRGMTFGPDAQPQLQTGLTECFYPGSPDAAHATELDVAPGAELDGIDVHLSDERLYSIRGQLTMPDVEKGGGINVFATRVPHDGRMSPYPMRMMNENQYEVFGLPPGTYTVVAQHFPPPKRGGQSGPVDSEYASQVVEVVDRDVDHIDLSPTPGATIKGVVKVDGSPLPNNRFNINLEQVDSSWNFNPNAQVSADGSFTLHAAPGKYRVRIFGPAMYVKTVLVGKETVANRVIDASRPVGDLTIVVSGDFGKVEGRVVDDEGKPVYNADVTLIPDQRDEDWPMRFRSAMTKPDGAFSVSAEPGEYRAFAWLGVEQGAPQDAEFRKPFEERGVTVKVEANGKATAELKVIRAPE